MTANRNHRNSLRFYGYLKKEQLELFCLAFVTKCYNNIHAILGTMSVF